MNPGDFEFFEKLLREESGFMLKQDKTYLLESRLLVVAQSLGLADAAEIALSLRMRDNDKLRRAVVEAMTSVETSFYRDKAHCQQLRNSLLPRLIASRADKEEQQLRFWSAGCSTGQEPYSLAMMLREYGALLAGWKLDILATDISKAVLAQARAGAYSQFDVQRGLPVQMLVKYFTQEDDRWVLSEAIRNMVAFRPHNLLEQPYAFGKFDVILCRHVLSDFDAETKNAVLSALARSLPEDGILMLGTGEDARACGDLRPVDGAPGYYRPALALFW